MLLKHLSIARIIDSLFHFLFDGCFELLNPTCHELFAIIRNSCPSIVRSLDPRVGEDTDGTADISLADDFEHRDPLGLHRIIYKNDEVDASQFVGVRILGDLDIGHAFNEELGQAFLLDYDLIVTTHLERKPLQWCRKISFTNRYVLPNSIYLLGVN